MVLTTATSVLLGAAIWAWLVWSNRSAPISYRRLILIVLLAGLICRVVFTFATPTFYAPDEQSHFNYVKYLYEQRSLPVQTNRTFSPANDYEYYQPPLYYLLSAPFFALARALFGPSDAAAAQVVRLLSIPLWLLHVAMAFKTVERLRIASLLLKLGVVGLVCLLPTYVFMSSVINNDNLLIALGSIILYRIAGTFQQREELAGERPPSDQSAPRMSEKLDLPGALLTGVLLGLAFLTKLTAIVYVFAIAALALLKLLRGPRSLAHVLHPAIIFSIALIMFLPWGLRNLALYGDITAEHVANVPKQWDSTYQAVFETQRYMKESFWSVSGIYNNITFLPSIGVHVTYFALVGIIYGLVRSGARSWDFLDSHSRHYLAAMSAAIAINIVLVFRFGILYSQGQGRFLFPLLIPIALVLATGIKLLGVEKRFPHAHIHAAGFLITYALAFVGYSLAMMQRAS